jgi:hypothetical protein
LPEVLKSLPDDAAALLVEVRGETAAALELRLAAVQQQLQGMATVTPVHFSKDAQARRRCGTCARASSRPSARCARWAPR